MKSDHSMVMCPVAGMLVIPQKATTRRVTRAVTYKATAREPDNPAKKINLTGDL